MSGVLRVSVCAILFGVCLLAGKADAFAPQTVAGADIEGVFCGIGHKNAKSSGQPALTGEAGSLIPIGPVLALSDAGGAMKCHLPNQLTGDVADSHPCHQMKCCDPASPSDGAALVFLQLDFAPAVVDALDQAPTSMPRGVGVASPLSRPEAPEPRPPASITA